MHMRMCSCGQQNNDGNRNLQTITLTFGAVSFITRAQTNTQVNI